MDSNNKSDSRSQKTNDKSHLKRERTKKRDSSAASLDINEKYADIFEKIDFGSDYDDILSEYEQTIERRAQATIDKAKGSTNLKEDPSVELGKTLGELNEEEQKPELNEDVLTVLLFVEELGLRVGEFFKKLWIGPKKFFYWAAKFISSVARIAWLLICKLSNKLFSKFSKQAKAFANDVRSAKKYFSKAKEDRQNTAAKLWDYTKKGLKKHKNLLRTVGNIALPALAIVAFIFTVNYWSSVTFALKVNYNDKEIGYIADETVYNEAQAAAKERMDTGRNDESSKLEEPTYELALVSLNELVDSNVLCDRIIENSSSNVTNACGIYIDDEFICAIKNETDATSVFHQILEPYEKKIKDKNSFVDFVEKVEYVQGLYSEDENTMWDASKLVDKLSQTKESAVKYTVKDGDTIYDIALKNDISVDELLALNPGKDESLFPGDQITISNEVNYVRVKLMKTETRKVEIDYETEKENNPSMFKGTKRTVREGKPGEEKVTELVTYIDGQRVSAQEVSRERIKEPVSAKVQVGSKPTTVSGGSYNVSVSGQGFVWPAPACTYISSYFGWRTLRGYSDFHTGLDLTKPGGGSTGAVVVASLDGTVESVQRTYSGYGHCIVINHGGGLKTRYAHCLEGSISVSVGQHVRAGQAIARVGSTGNVTGPHLHFEIIINGQCVNPLPYLR